jgi:predicted enzyme related to lactoylglutathione lyase
VPDTPPPIGSIAWHDLTVPDASATRDFYRHVVGWSADPLEMGGYSDYCMKPPAGEVAAGICHARGTNANIPPVWLMYIIVANLDTSLAQVRALGGTVVVGPKSMGDNQYAVIRDPAGAVVALYQAGPPR